MNVFLSWSGERSRYVAEAFRGWLPKVIQAIDPWMSKEDISSGTRWSSEIASKLEASSVGVVFITPENQFNPWIMFEAGALSKTMEASFVCPYLFGLTPSQLTGPMSQFQASTADQEGTRNILKSLNEALGIAKLPNEELDEIFEVWWPKLESLLDNCPEYQGKKIDKRSAEEILEEVVENTREQLRREEIRLKRQEEADKRMDSLISFAETMAIKDMPNLEKLINSVAPLAAGTPLENLLANIPQTEKFQEAIEGMKGLQEMDKVFRENMLNKPEED